jgi:flagellar biosynthetic protein FlhB
MDEEEKTEEPSSKRLGEAREKGQVPKSVDLLQAATLLAGAIALWTAGSSVLESLRQLTIRTFQAIPVWRPSDAELATGLAFGLWELAKILLPLLLPIAATGIVVSLAMTGPLWASKVFAPDLGALFSIGNLARMFNKRALVELLKGVLKITVVGWVAWSAVQRSLPQFAAMAAWSFLEQVVFTVRLAFWAVVKMGVALLIMGVADFFWQRHSTRKKLKMTKQEVKDEARQSEGDPQVKSKRRRMRQEMHRRFSLRQVPKATVVVTNPTHFSVALRFEQGVDPAPVMVAKGADAMAFRIREIARASNVPLVENPPVARALYARVEPGDQVPPELYQAVAEVLAFVMRARR